MSLTPGTRIGSYEITALLGAGGMGEVYRARDARLNRDVAIKVLPDAFAADRDRVVRFEREAQTLASLNHPNIAHIHGVIDAPLALVMECVDGEDLAQRIARGPIRLDDAVPIARQIASALDAAHERGIVHRDLKPANVKLSTDGAVKVLDFGLAKAAARDVSGAGPPADQANSPTLSVHGTEMGVILGTAAYMSPEQARGKAVDRRTDIWAFGCVLYEMLTGRRAFDGETISDIVASVLQREPDWTALPPDVPPHMRRLLHRCLEKDTKRRLRDAGDVALELDAGDVDGVAAQAPGPAHRIAWLSVTLIAVAAAALGAAATWFMSRSPATPALVSRYSLPLPADAPLDVRGPWSSLAISRDGRTYAYIALVDRARRLFIRRADDPSPQLVDGAVDPWEAFFSPDGRWLAFIDSDRLKKVSLTGGQPLLIAEAPNLNSGVWADDGTIYLGGRAGLVKVDSSGKSTTLLQPAPDEVELGSPDLLPGGALLFTIKPDDVTSFDDARIAVLTPDGQKHVLIEGGVRACYSPSGHIVYARGGEIMAVAFDERRLAIVGHPVAIEHGGMLDQASGSAEFALARNGTFVFAPGGPVVHARKLVWVDSHGTLTPLEVPPRFYSDPVISPDGRAIAFDIRAANDDIWTYDPARGRFTRLTFTHGNHQMPAWSPDGSRIIYALDRLGVRRLAWRAADGSDAEELLTPPEYYQTPGSISPDGKVLVYTEDRPETSSDIYMMPLQGNRTAVPFIATPRRERNPVFSPDGRWIAYESYETGGPEIFVTAYPDHGKKWQVSTEGGMHPVWLQGGTAIGYGASNPGRIMVAPVTIKGASFDSGQPRQLVPLPPSTVSFDIARDGGRVLALTATGDQDSVRELNVVLNWFSVLASRADR